MKSILAVVLLATACTAQADDILTRFLNRAFPGSALDSSRWTQADWDMVAFQQWQELSCENRWGGPVPVPAATRDGAARHLARHGKY